jgi:hypothetical protein
MGSKEMKKINLKARCFNQIKGGKHLWVLKWMRFSQRPRNTKRKILGGVLAELEYLIFKDY